MSDPPRPDGEASPSPDRGVMASLSPLPPNPYGAYTVVGKLGHGRLAELLLATKPSSRTVPDLVVVKRLHRHLQGEDDFVEAFLDEVRIAVKLDHSNIVRTHDHGEAEGDLYFVMEFLEGQGLDRVMRRCFHRGVKLPPELVGMLGIKILEGLQYAHGLRDDAGGPLQVVHRDIRPQNIFVTYEGQVKLLDFGIAKAATKVVQSSQGSIKGKYAYIAPEQAREHRVDSRADIWSVGVVLWEALASRSLFTTEGSIPGQLAAISDAPIPSLVEVAPDTPKPIAEVIHKALRRDVDARYQTASAMAQQLKVAIKGHPEAGQMRLRDFMTDLFSDVMIRNRTAIAQCLKGQSVSGEFDIIPSTPSNPAPPRDNSMRLTKAIKIEKVKTERRLYVVVGVAVVLILLAAAGVRLLGSW